MYEEVPIEEYYENGSFNFLTKVQTFKNIFSKKFSRNGSKSSEALGV